MQIDATKAALTAGWISVVCAAGLAGNVRSLSGWTALAGLTVVPPLVMMWRWNHPRPTMSESIQKALR